MSDLEFTGERFVPGTSGELSYEHWHRYAFVRRFVAGKRVLDAACGEGYGTALIANVAAEAIGVDIDSDTVAHARECYAQQPNVRFETGSVTSVPLADCSVDVVISFETVEHIPASDQPLMIGEFARVLAPGGLLIISTPNKRLYSDERDYRNPFHLHELYRDQLEALLDAKFPYRRWFQQTRSYTSALWSDDFDGGDARCEVLMQEGARVAAAGIPDGLYYVVFAAASASALPAMPPQLSLFADCNDSEQKRVEAQSREVLRLDGLLKHRDAALDRQTLHIRHLEELVAYRERIVEERDAQLVAVNAAREWHEQALADERAAHAQSGERLAEASAQLKRCEAELAASRKSLHALQTEHRNLQAAIDAQERIISHRQTLQWWLRLPLLRAKLSWQHWRGQ
jgi:SAM-dependent methyltransferase